MKNMERINVKKIRKLTKAINGFAEDLNEDDISVFLAAIESNCKGVLGMIQEYRESFK